jgi:hypothetical protein
MADQKPKTTRPKAIIDVTHPDKSAPSPTAKSIIVNNHPLLQDPMVVPEAANDEPASSLPSTPKASRIIIKPIHDDVAAETSDDSKTASPEASAETAPAAAEDNDEVKESPIAEAKPEATEPDAPAEPPKLTAPLPADQTEPDEAATPPAQSAETDEATGEPDDKDDNTDKSESATDDKDASVQAADAKPKTDKAADDKQQAAELAKHEAATQKLIESEQYFLPINSVEKRKARRFVVLGIVLALLLAIAWADIALDAGLIHIHGVKAFTHFFSS